MTSNVVHEVEFNAPAEAGQRVGVFCAVTAWCRIYEGYSGVADDVRALLHPMVLLVDRWDGLVGFPGGFVDGDEKPEDAVVRELVEEVGCFVGAKPEPLVSHRVGCMVLRLYRLHLGVCEPALLRSVMVMSAMARDSLAEGFATWRHCADYGRGDGFSNLRGSDNLAPAVAEELDVVVETFVDSMPPGSAPAWRAECPEKKQVGT